MELVYLWVEDYKNIHKQGFNFSPRFECEFKDEYNEDGKLKDNCELVINPKEHLENFFGKNINITAIVGENGSGKSSIVTKIINNIIFNTKVEYKSQAPIICFLNDAKDKIYIYSHLIEDKSNIISEFDFRLTHYRPDIFPKELNDEYKDTKFWSIKISKDFKKEYYRSFFYLYNNSLEIDSNHYNTYEYNEELLFFSEINKSDNTIDLTKETDKIYTYLTALFFEKERIPKQIDNFFVPTRLFLDRDILIKYFKNIDEEMKYHTLLENNPNIHDILKLETLLYLKFYIKTFNVLHHEDIKEEIESLFQNKNIIESYNDIFTSLKLEIANKILSTINYIKKEIRYDDNKSNDIKELNELEKILLLITMDNELITLIKKINNSYGSSEDYEMKIELLNKDKVNYLKQLPSYLKINFATKKGRKFNELSSGEQSLLKLMLSIENIIQLRKNRTDSLYILLDEIENSFHPDWQKRVLNWLVQFLKHYDMQINIIVATHSPYILSDIPKENIIFLKDGEQVNVNINPFGANTHTLLSHGFFMQDGLMGEFAKEKINQVYNFIKNNETKHIKSKDEAQQIINIIGEPLIQNQLQNLLYEKFKISTPKDEEIDYLKKRLSELEK